MAGIHNNKLVIEFLQLTLLDIREIGNKITDGEEYQGTEYSVDNHTCTITVKAGRSGSKEVADYFNIIPEDRCLVTSSNASHPDKLNFAVEIIMRFVDCNDTIFSITLKIAQGHTTTHNNWWIGGQALYKVEDIYGQGRAIMLPRESNKNYALPIHVSEINTNTLNMVLIP